MEAATFRTIYYYCGIPKIGQAAFGISNYNPSAPAPGFTPGGCSMHVVQYQRGEFGVGLLYAFDVVVFDNAKKQIATLQKAPIDGATLTLTVDKTNGGSQLPLPILITAGGGDYDPVKFAYGDQHWQSGDGTHNDNFGTGPEHGYQSGNRKRDMGFVC